MLNRRSIHSFLRFRLGQWPPDRTPDVLKRFRAHLESLEYKPRVIDADVRGLRRFLAYLEENGVQVDAVRKADIDAFVELQLKRYRKRHRREPRDWFGWRSHFTGPIRSLLGMLNLRWPTAPSANTPWDCFTKRVCDGYGGWLTEVHGLSAGTLEKNSPIAAALLAWLGQQPESRSLERLSTDDIDRFLASRLPPLRRATRLGVCSSLRSFLRYLHYAKYIPRDLAVMVTQPSHYQFEEIPCSFTPEQVEGVLAAARKDRSPTGLRDYAILLLLATYGLRGGEVRRLKLDDIEWRGERLRIHQSKTGAESVLPLVEPVAEALLDYLQHGRPNTSEREVFLRAYARRGAHAFRFARAISMMRASVSLKWIGDLLGHHHSDSTQTYIRLAMDDLRELSLELPGDKP
jgi:site-specific recombinase XerD